MAWSKKDLEKLEKAYMTGTLEVEYENQRVRYRSLDEIKSLIDEAKYSLGLISQSPQTLNFVPRLRR